jgi:hypothetical protein
MLQGSNAVTKRALPRQNDAVSFADHVGVTGSHYLRIGTVNRSGSLLSRFFDRVQIPGARIDHNSWHARQWLSAAGLNLKPSFHPALGARRARD